jgi:hypothetical protein
MSEHFFDELARQLRDGPMSRRRPLIAVAGMALAAGLPALAPHEAAASRAKKKCKKRGGTWLATADSTSPCHCAWTCSSTKEQHCHNTSCDCVETTEEEGFCAGGSPVSNGCDSSTQCTGDAKCAILSVAYGVCGADVSCNSTAECQSKTTMAACINGKCQITACVPPCA